MASVKPRTWTKPDGTAGRAFEVRYIDPETGKRPSKTFTLKKDADAFKRKVEREIEDGQHVTRAATLKMSAVMDAYLDQSRSRLRDGQIGQSHHQRQELVCRVYLAPAIGRILAKDLSVDDVWKVYQSVVNNGAQPLTGKLYLRTLQMIEQMARKRGWMKTQPTTDVLSDLRTVPRTKIETFTPAEITRLLAASQVVVPGGRRRSTAFLACAVALASLCGMRVGEIQALRMENVDLDRRMIYVRHNLTTFGEMKGPKSAAGVRDIPIPAAVAELLVRWRDMHVIENEWDLFFTNYNGDPVTYYAIHVAWKRLLVGEEMHSRHFHALRHFYASWLLRHGMPVADVSKMLGHSSHDMTLKVYTHALMDHTEAVSRVDHIAGLLPARDASVTKSLVTA